MPLRLCNRSAARPQRSPTRLGAAPLAGIVGGAQHFIWSGFGGQLMGDNIIFEQNLYADALFILRY